MKPPAPPATGGHGGPATTLQARHPSPDLGAASVPRRRDFDIGIRFRVHWPKSARTSANAN
jgi:hypothetical protein